MMTFRLTDGLNLMKMEEWEKEIGPNDYSYWIQTSMDGGLVETTEQEGPLV